LEHLESVNWSPPFQGPFSLTSAPLTATRTKPEDLVGRKIEQWNRAAKVFNRLIHRPSGIYERLMKPGECVIFDNRRVLHARRAFAPGDEGQERWLRGAYIDKDPFLSKMKVLARAAHFPEEARPSKTFQTRSLPKEDETT
jgi:alpha-ketoglutarate-dependent taurine dioxygenase